MDDDIKLPRSILAPAAWQNGNLARIILFLAAQGCLSGDANVSLREISRQTGLTLKEVRTAIGKLGAAQKTAQKRAQKTAQQNVSKSEHLITLAAQKRSQERAQKTAQQNTLAKDGFERFRQWYNATVESTEIPRLMKFTDARKKALLSIFKEYGKETVEQAMRKVIASDFLSHKWGKCGFDWIFKKNNFLKILEGYYDNLRNQKQQPDDDFRRHIISKIAAADQP